MGTPGLYPRVIGAEWPLTAQLEAIIADGMHDGELRGDSPADLLALAGPPEVKLPVTVELAIGVSAIALAVLAVRTAAL
jgi:hypothetical protein